MTPEVELELIRINMTSATTIVGKQNVQEELQLLVSQGAKEIVLHTKVTIGMTVIQMYTLNSFLTPFRLFSMQ